MSDRVEASQRGAMYQYNLGILFQDTAKRYADRPAIRFDVDAVVSYGELEQRANRLGRRLHQLGARAGDVICVSGVKCLDTLATMLACLKIGAPYAVLDPDSPAERLRKIVATCQPRIVVADPSTRGKMAEACGGMTATVLEMNSATFDQSLADLDGGPLAESRHVTGSQPAYIMFTSGSTGFPKGAVMTHANVLNLVAWSRETYGIEPWDVLTNVNPLFFDNSVFDFYSSLFNGASLVPFTKDEVRDPGRLVAKCDGLGCTLWFSVPSLLIFLQTMKATDGQRLGSIRRFVFGGEGYPKAKLKQLYDAYPPPVEFHNVYGPTECTCICSSYQLRDEDFRDLQGLPPLGELAPNFSYLVLDESDRMLPPGGIGELCLLGPQVGRGYYNDRSRTDAAFVLSPAHQFFKETMYRTGDLVRVDPGDGRLHILGRKDNQIKHMGYRIELEEIEAAMHCLDYVSEAAAIHVNDGRYSRIIAVLAGDRTVGDERIRADLRNLLPEYMVPTAFFREEVLPKNANGKVDRRQIAERHGA